MTLQEAIEGFRKEDNDEIAKQLADWLEELRGLRTKNEALDKYLNDLKQNSRPPDKECAEVLENKLWELT